MAAIRYTGDRAVSLDNDFFIPIVSLQNNILALNATTNQLTTATWCQLGSRYLSSVNLPGAGLLRDMGRTYVSGGRTFRSIQLVVPQSTGTVSTFGVNGAATGTQPLTDYLKGFIEVGFPESGAITPAGVAKWGR